MITFKNKKTVITGGASGIGKIMARKALERGVSHLIIWDINSKGLEQLQQDFNHFNIPITTYLIDLSIPEAVTQLSKRVLQEIGPIDILINNAGIIVGKPFIKHTPEEISKTIRINAEAPMHTTLVFLPAMLEQDYGAVCTIASSAGLISSTQMSVYIASKWAAVGWSDSVRLEVLKKTKNVSITTIMPYYINTGMFDGVKSKILPILDPEKTSEKIIVAIEKQTKMLAMPLPYWVIRITQGLFPLSFYQWLMEHVFGIYETMNTFKGRKE